MDASGATGAAEPEVDPALAAVLAALADIAQRGSAQSSTDLRAQLRLLERVTRTVEAAVIGVVADCERTAAFFDDGHVSVRNWVAAETNTPTASALARARAARLVNACPQVAAALASGQVGASQVYEMGRARANPRVGHLLDDVVDELLAEAAVMPLPGFLALVRQWEALIDQDGAHRDHDAAHAARRLRTSRLDDEPGGELRARFGDEQIAAIIESRAPDFDTRSLRWRLCATTNGVPVNPTAVVAAALVGHVRRIVVDGSGRIMDVGRRCRIFTGAAREAALLQALLDTSDGRCLWPGCGRRRNCQIDHTTEWQHDGVRFVESSDRGDEHRSAARRGRGWRRRTCRGLPNR